MHELHFSCVGEQRLGKRRANIKAWFEYTVIKSGCPNSGIRSQLNVFTFNNSQQELTMSTLSSNAATPSNAAAQANSQQSRLQAEAALSNMAREFRSFVADVEDLIKATNTLTGDELNRAKAKLEQRISAAKSSVEVLGAAIAERARQGAKTADNYVHEQPWTAIGASAGVGLVVGYLLSRR
jgi:ElaB/YqjD/DUF883 family membrane-anchored ribosome-binding protein